MFAYDSALEGLDAVIGRFAGFRDLLDRPDAAQELLSYYKDIDYGNVLKSKGPFPTLKVEFLDYFMSREEILLGLSVDERADLLDTCKKTIQIKTEQYPETFSIASTLYLAARVMQIDDKDFYETISNQVGFNSYITSGSINQKLWDIIVAKLDDTRGRFCCVIDTTEPSPCALFIDEFNTVV